MKRLGLIFLLLLDMVASMLAQDITGKWECSKETLKELADRRRNISGYYRFYENGKFKLYIRNNKYYRGGAFDYTRQIDPKRFKLRGSGGGKHIKVSGTYMVKDGKITTAVKPKKVKVYIDTGENLSQPLDMNSSDYDHVVHDMRDRWSEHAAFMAEVQENTIRNERTYLWDWQDIPLTLTEDSLTIGNMIRCSRDK